MKEKIKKNKFIIYLYREYLYLRNKLLCKINPKLAANIVYKKVFGRNINWENPQNLIEKIAWMELHSDISLWTLCADKYRVREYIKKKGCEETLVKLYGMWENPDDIDFDKLPNSFVLKANNGCGTVMLVKDKTKLNYNNTKKELKEWIKRPYGYASAQLHYLDIKPCIIAEEILLQSEALNTLSPHSLVDFKVWCLNGEPEAILVTYNRTPEKLMMHLYSTKWENISHNIIDKHHHYKVNYNDNIPKPTCLDKMLEYSKTLAGNFPQARIDFYEIDGEAKFGEITMATGYGYFTPEYYEYLGSKIDLNKIKRVK